MPMDERRAMIAREAIPLFIQYGAAVTTRQLADHLNLAEGTIFRAFGDKESLIKAVVEAYFDQAHESVAPELADPELSLQDKVSALVRTARRRTEGMFAILSLLESDEAHRILKGHKHRHFEDISEDTFAADLEQLNFSPEQLGPILRLVLIAASAPPMAAGKRPEDEDLVKFIMYGLAGEESTRPNDQPGGNR